MDKTQLFIQIKNKLERVFDSANAAAQRAYDTATDEGNEAENKYDTLGLEASYLAHGQSKRVAECESDCIKFNKFQLSEFSDDDPVSIGALVCIEDESGVERYLLLSPVAGGLNINFEGVVITLITVSSPIGQSLLNHVVGDDIEVEVSKVKKLFQISAIY